MFTQLKTALCAFGLLYGGLSYSQGDYYWSSNIKNELSTDQASMIVQFKAGISPENYINRNAENISSIDIHTNQSRIVVHFKNKVEKDAQTYASSFIKDMSVVKSSQFGFQLSDGFPIWATDRVILQLNKEYSLNDINSLLGRFNATHEETKYGRVRLKVEDLSDVLPLANALKEGGFATWAHPDFYAKVEHFVTPSDTYYSNQFQMNNANDIDCDAPEAWDLTTGSSSLRVAVIDDGVETHPDLPNLNTSIGYSPANNGDGTPNASGAHGVACAGIIGAGHNGFGVAGAAPGVELFSVNIFLGGETSADLADAITYSKNNGADVLSNSWGFGSCTYSVSALNSAITDAKNNGRNGKGCVIVFASGNDFGSCVSYPANYSDCIAVGAITNTGVRSGYSNQGSTLDISAPSNGGTISVYTTDRVGSSGYGSGDYTPTFGGTSAACPLVSGVAALVLSANSSLTSSEVQTILESTATDMGSAGFDVEFGHGRVDADDAINAALGNDDGDDDDDGDDSCNTGVITLQLVTDNYGSETTWSLTNASGSVVESGSGYASNSTQSFNWNLSNGDYTFVINDSYGDGICCAYGQGSYSLTDAAGDVIISGGAFGSSETTAFCIEGNDDNDGGDDPCPTIDLSAATINAYGGNQDAGSSNVGSAGELVISNNAWKYIDYNYTITPNTVIEFDFGSTSQGEIHGIGFDDNNGINSNRTFRLYGTQNWGIANFNDYSASAGSWKSYTIPVGQFYTGSVDRLFFVCDDDAGGAGNSYYANIKVYEQGSCGNNLNIATLNAIPSIVIGNEGEDAINVRLFPNPTKDILNVSVDNSLTGELRVTDIMGRLMIESTIDQATTQVETSRLPEGVYQLSITTNDGQVITKRFVKQ